MNRKTNNENAKLFIATNQPNKKGNGKEQIKEEPLGFRIPLLSEKEICMMMNTRKNDDNGHNGYY